MTAGDLKSSLRLPLFAAPMLNISSPNLVVGACRAGVVGSIPMDNAPSAAAFEAMLVDIEDRLTAAAAIEGQRVAPHAVSIIVRDRGGERFDQHCKLLARRRPPIVISSGGHPGSVVETVHDYGGLVFHDVATMGQVGKATEAGVDGLVLLSHGAGGHTGAANPFAFVRDVRQRWDGLVALAGAIGDGLAIRAAEALGADFAFMETRFAATKESWASPACRAQLVGQEMAEGLGADRISGLKVTAVRDSIEAAGVDPDTLPPLRAPCRPDVPDALPAWRDLFSAGQAVGTIPSINGVAHLVDQLEAEYRARLLST